MAKRPLTPRELDQLGQAAFSNARELLADARLLFEAESWPRAFALAALAAEEVGKYGTCWQAIGSPPGDEAAWRTFWNDLRNHRPKIASMSGPLMDSIAVFDPAHEAENRDRWAQVRATLTDRDSGLAKAIDQSKMAALYVDFEDDNVLVPHERVDRLLAQSMINAVSRAIAYAPSR